MKILYIDKKKRKKYKIKVLPQSMDDIWHLSNIIEEGDFVSALSYRSKEKTLDKLRTGKEEKEAVYISIMAQWVEFHDFSNRLRVHGIIQEPMDYEGHHHTLNIEVGKDVAIVKEWKKKHLDRIKEAIELSNRPLIEIISMDEDEAVIAMLHQSGIQEIARISSNRSGKMYKSEDKRNEYYGKILSKIENERNLILIGPGFAKEEFHSFGKSRMPKAFKNCFIASVCQSGMVGIREGMKRGIFNMVVGNSRILFEEKLIEEFFEEIAKDGLVAYGEKEVEIAVKMGAVKELLLTNELLRKKEKLAREAEKKGAIIRIITTEARKKLKSLGGIGAILRYAIV
jgi:protein pelota